MSENVNSTGSAKSNYEGSQEALFDHAKALAKQALLDLAMGDKKGIDGTAGQRMSACVLYEFEALKMANDKPRDFADYLRSKETRDAVTPLYVNRVIGPMPVNPRGKAAEGAKVYPANVLNDLQADWKRKRALVVRGLEIASVVLKFSVPMDQFNEKAGTWTMPKTAFLKAGYVCKDDVMFTQLGGTTFFGTKSVAGKNTDLDKIKPSVTRLLVPHKATAQRGTQSGNAGTTGQTEASAQLHKGIDATINELWAVLNKRNSDKNWTPNINDFGRPLWNKLQDIARFVNDWSSNETFFVKPKTTPVAKVEEKKAA